VTQSSPGWYPDPSGATGQRYFDGTEWTEHRSPSLQQPPTKKSNTATVLAVLGIVGVLAVGGIALKGFANQAKTSATAGINQTVSDGQFTFRVNQVAYSGGYETYSKPRGQWAVVIMDIVNSGDKPQTFFPNNQKLFDAQGREYGSDTMAAIEMNADGIMDLNPGFSASVKVPFDLPPGTTPDMIELHDSAFSGGVKVKLN
jgi:hypothetical protein